MVYDVLHSRLTVNDCTPTKEVRRMPTNITVERLTSLFTPGWRSFLLEMSDFTRTNDDINRYRFCCYLSEDAKRCGECIGACPHGALANSVPTPHGEYPSHIVKQTYWFWEGKLQFDSGRCFDDREQLQTIFPDWSCARCISICASVGKRSEQAAKSFYQEMARLARG
jgi:ferredoxin